MGISRQLLQTLQRDELHEELTELTKLSDPSYHETETSEPKSLTKTTSKEVPTSESASSAKADQRACICAPLSELRCSLVSFLPQPPQHTVVNLHHNSRSASQILCYSNEGFWCQGLVLRSVSNATMIVDFLFCSSSRHHTYWQSQPRDSIHRRSGLLTPSASRPIHRPQQQRWGTIRRTRAEQCSVAGATPGLI